MDGDDFIHPNGDVHSSQQQRSPDTRPTGYKRPVLAMLDRSADEAAPQKVHSFMEASSTPPPPPPPRRSTRSRHQNLRS